MKKFIIFFLTVLAFFVQPVFADVITTHKTPTDDYYTNTQKGFIFRLPDEISARSGIDCKWIIGAGVIFFFLLLLIAVLLIRIRQMQNEADKTNDAKMGMGNMRFFKHHFRHTVGGGSGKLYCDTPSVNRVQEEKEITESILKGLDNNEFKMYLQFVVDNKTKKIVSAEALSRWEHPEKGVIAPAEYIENMETSGIITKHDFYMFSLVCRQLEKWADTEYKDISISCNFTRITLSEKNFVDKLKGLADRYEFDKSKLAIEITEDAIEKDREIATENVMLCKDLGFRIYLDDLGSGYTSLSNLCDYPIDVVKIDRDILLKADTNRGKDLFSGIIALAHSLDISVICEGVETEEQNTLVSKSGCDYVQGWYYSKALPLEECEQFIEKYEVAS